MGMDLIVAWTILPISPVRWEEMRAMVRDCSDEEILQADSGGMYYEDDEVDEGRKFWLQRIDDFEDLVTKIGTQDQWRDTVVIDVKGFKLLVCGGSSYGDDPGDGFSALGDMLEWPDLMHAGGFDA